jgi:transposase
MQVTTIGLDIAKSVFQVHGVDAEGEVVVRKRLTRAKLLDFFGKLSPCLVGIEACASAHHWARELIALGHDARLMPPNYVKPYLKRNKNDASDAEAICEAVTRKTMRFVPVKTREQQALMVLHGVRAQIVRARTMISNTIRGFLSEFGIVAAKGRTGLEGLVQCIEDATDDRLPQLARDALRPLLREFYTLRDQVLEMDRKVAKAHRASELSQRLATIPGVGPVTASLLTATVADPKAFKSGRAMAAWIGLTPKQNSSGEKERLGSITKACDSEIRRLLVLGAMAVIKMADRLGYDRYPWLHRLVARRHKKVAAVALANKMARTAWALMVRGGRFNTQALTPSMA